jgi:hypothetical protein
MLLFSVLCSTLLLLLHLPPPPPPASYHTDPSGTYVKYRCMAIGSGSEGAQTALQEQYKPELSLAEAEVLALATLKQVMEEKVRGCVGGGVREQTGGCGDCSCSSWVRH